jgi:copper chaperone CopZ
MKTTINLLMCGLVFIGFASCGSAIKNTKTESFNVSGNCGMCEKTIETAGNLKGVSLVDWDKNTKIASISYNTKKTNSSAVLKRIALAGYDNEEYIAPDEVYAKLPNCCQYDRTLKGKTEKVELAVSDSIVPQKDEVAVKTDQLVSVFENYFLVKDALVTSNGTSASTSAQLLVKALALIDMNKLSEAEHLVWMKIAKDLKEDAMHISGTKDIEHQRDHFGSLSDNMYALMKVSENNSTVYYQHCPMANDGKGANWLSLESTIKNPFYGAKMLSCGKTVETIK